jgi:Tol biopolymer transport system component
VSDNGSLFYVPGPVSATYLNLSEDLALMDRKGGVEGLKFPVGTYQYPRVSPDGKRIAFGTDDGKESIVWVFDLPGTSSPRRLTFGGKNRFPIWSSDGQHVAFQSDRDGDLGIFWQLADGTGTAERLTKPDSETSHVPESWLPHGDRFLFSVTQRQTVSLWTYSLREKKAEPFGGVQSANLTNAAFSPDGRWVAYTTAMTPRSGVDSAIYVQPFPATGAMYLASKNGDQGHDPLWSWDGKELFYVPLPNQFVVVTMTTQPTVGFSNPVPVQRRFGGAGPTTPRPFDIMPDGRIIAPLDTSQTQTGPQIQVVLNWFEELKQRVPAAR